MKQTNLEQTIALTKFIVTQILALKMYSKAKGLSMKRTYKKVEKIKHFIKNKSYAIEVFALLKMIGLLMVFCL